MKTNKFTAVIITFILICTIKSYSIQVKKQDLKILYVGGSTNFDTYLENPYSNEKEKEDDIARRMKSFEQMLNMYFSSVTVINAKDYQQKLSSQYDVTIMDGLPPALSEKQIIRDALGRLIKIIPAAYLTDDFNSPMVFIGEMGEKLGSSIGVKTDWYCLCLDAYAFNFNKSHEIFNKPFPVKLTIEERATAEEAFHYHYFFDKPIPKTLPMWRVQTKGYKTDKGFRIGLVSRPWGFTDSPDAEVISGGVSMKSLDAVAIGRHGNFLQWGFIASPEYMTDEAQTVLANAICYISKFKNKGLIARKYNEYQATRDYLKELKYLASKEAYTENTELTKKFDEEKLKEKILAEEKKKKGDKLSRSEEMALNYKQQPSVTIEEFVKRYQKPELFDKFGTDHEAYVRYFDENKNYFYGDNGPYTFSIDEDIKSLKIPNDDIMLLDKCIKMLEQNDDTDKAKRILDRYTLVDFATPQQWRNWFNDNKDKLFFTEAGGFKFMVNSYDKSAIGNDYSLIKAPESENYFDAKLETDRLNPVAVSAYSVEKDNHLKELVLRLKIHEGFHLYADLPNGTPFMKTDVKIKLPDGYQKVKEMTMPSAVGFGNEGMTVYTGEITFMQEIKGSGGGEAVFVLSWQSCDDHVCLPPVKDMEVKVKLF